MNSTLDYICKKFNIRLQPDSDHRCNYQSMPLEISLNRQGLAKLFAELNFIDGAEIGVEQGEYSEVLARNNPQLKCLYLIDAWTAYKGYRDHVSQSKLDGFLKKVQERMAALEKPGEMKRFVITKEFSVDAAKKLQDGCLDFVYIDSNHELSHVVADIAAWSPKVRVGGIVAGHDWFSSGGPYHVPFAVKAWTDAYKITPYFICRGDHTASWFWVKQ